MRDEWVNELNTADAEMDQRLTRALEARPVVNIPADFAVRVARQLPERRPIALTPTHYGRKAMVVCMVVLGVALLHIALVHELLQKLGLFSQIGGLLRLPRQYDQGVVIHLIHASELFWIRVRRRLSRLAVRWSCAGGTAGHKQFLDERLSLDQPLVVGICNQQAIRQLLRFRVFAGVDEVGDLPGGFVGCLTGWCWLGISGRWCG